jgi:hypothetical protein
VIEQTIAALVENDGQIGPFAPPTRIEPSAGGPGGSTEGGAAPRDGGDGSGGPRNPPPHTEPWPSLEGLPVDYLIITSDELAPSFNPLADWKQAKGWNTAIRTVTAIRARYPGVDVQESVRNFIIEAGELWGTTWVLLGGDTDQVPHRPGFYDWYHGGNPYGPTDLYFATADGNWNANGNAIFGEYEDNVDEGIDFHVGRAPTENAAEANVFVQKVLAYEQSPPPNFVTRHLLMGATYDCVSYPTYHWGQWCKETIKDIIYGNSDTHFIWRLYNVLTDNSTFWGDELLNHGSAVTHLQAGYHFINHCDHSGIYAMGTGSKCWGGVITNADASALTNAPRNGIILSLGCSPNAFDYDSISEAFMNNPHGGTVAYMGNTRTGYTGQPPQDIAFFQQVFTNGVTHLGEAFSIARSSTYDSYYRRVLNLLGDPEMVVWTAGPSGMEVVHPDSVRMGEQAITVRAQEPLIYPPVPIVGAKVCLYSKNEVFSVGTTGPDGAVVLNFTCDTGAPLTLTVTAQNRLPYQGLLNVSIGAAPHLYVSAYEIDDDTTAIGNSDGNDDGRPDVGETIEMPLHVTNSGGAPAADITVRLFSETPGVTVLWDQFYVGTINPGQTVVTQPFLFHISENLSPETLAEFRVELGNMLSVPEVDRLWFTIHAPELTVNCNNLYDDGTGGSQGNGNGIPEGGETVAIYMEIGDPGHGAAREVSGTLTSNSPRLVVLDGQTWVGDIPAMSSAVAADPLLVAIDPEWMGNETLTLVLSDHYAPRGTFTIDLSGPSTPTGLAFTSGEDWIHVTWQPVQLPDLLGYHVYRAEASTGPFQRLDTLVQAGASFYHDVIVAAGTAARIFYYYVTAVDASGNEGPPSAVLKAWLTHHELPGWPIKLTGAAIRSAAVADVDHDGDLEIFIGALENKVYGFHHNGTEIYDIDHDPTTVSGFALLDPSGSAWGDMALGDLDRDGSLDLVCTSRGGENKVYAWTMFDNNGDDMPDPVPGWPVYLGPGNERSLSATALADVDEDGWLEVIFSIENGPPGQEGQVHVIDARGFEEINWPQYGLGDWSYATPAVGHLSTTGDIGMDIVAGGSNGNLYVWRYDGQLLPGWPVQTGGWISSSPALGDLDGDGDLEILQNSQNGILWAFEANGTPVAGWEGGKSYPSTDGLMPSPALADISGDPRPEVFVATRDGVAAWSPNGTPLPGWPVTLAPNLGTESSPIVADIDGDGQYEILVGFGSERVYALHEDGTIVTHWPAPAGENVVAAPTVEDLDGDGDLEVIAPAAYTLHIWDCPDQYGVKLIPWGTFHQDIARTGVYRPVAAPYPLGDLNCDHKLTVGDIGPFALALVDPDAYNWQWFWCDINLADVNGDGTNDGLDVQTFVTMLLGGG